MADIIIDGTTIASKSGSNVSLQNINSGSFSSELTIPSGTTRPSNLWSCRTNSSLSGLSTTTTCSQRTRNS